MQGNALYGPLKLLGYIVVLLMIVAMAYAGYTSIAYWSGIGV